MLLQRKLAEQFIQEVFHDELTGANIAAYHTFPKPASFLQRLKTLLRNLLDSFVMGMNDNWRKGSWEGSPYRVLEPFEAEHAPVFFGRDKEICDVLDRLR